MKISRRRFTQLFSGLLLSPLVKNAEASPEVQPEAPPALFPPFTQIEGIAVGDTAAAPDPLFVGLPRGGIVEGIKVGPSKIPIEDVERYLREAPKPVEDLSDEEIENMARWIAGE